MPAVFRNSERSEDFAMSSLILPKVSRQTRRLRKETATNNNQMPGLSDFLPNPQRRFVQQLARIFSSQPAGGCSRSQRGQRTGPRNAAAAKRTTPQIVTVSCAQ